MRVAEQSPEERTAEAQRLREQGDPRPVSQIEAEMLAQDQAGQRDTGQDKAGRTGKGDGKPPPG